MATVTVTPLLATSAEWTLQGPLGYLLESSGSAVLEDLDHGVYLMTWADAVGYSTPTLSIGVVGENESLDFVGHYREVLESTPIRMRERVREILESAASLDGFIVQDSIDGQAPAAKFCERGYIEVDVDSESETDNWDDAFSEVAVTIGIRVFARDADRTQMKNKLIQRVASVKEALASDANDLDLAGVKRNSVRFGSVDYRESQDDDGLDIQFADMTVTAVFIENPADRYAG